MIKTIDFRVPFPPSVNCLYRDGGKGKRPKTKRYLEWCKRAGQFIIAFKADNPSFVTIREPITVLYRHGEPDIKRQRDVENYSKAISDLLKDEGIIEDDSLIKTSIADWAEDMEAGMTEVMIASRTNVRIKIDDPLWRS